ncbi:MAG: hypothetical protein MZV64_09890 [Ignavibacteriales bacterium]|nr:hypothetical protein [Ignavibacteriales bacterium]
MGGDLPLDSIPENDDLRIRWMDGSDRAPGTGPWRFRTAARTTRRRRWRLESIRGLPGLLYRLVPDREVLYGQGAWIIKRDLADRRQVAQAKVFLRNGPNAFLAALSLRGTDPSWTWSIYRGVVRRDVDPTRAVPESSCIPPFGHRGVDPGLRGLGPPVAGAGAVRQPSRPWSGPCGNGWADSGTGTTEPWTRTDGRSLIAGGSPGAEPGLNCSGFAKWVVDGMLKPITRFLASPWKPSRRNEDLPGLLLHPALRGGCGIPSSDWTGAGTWARRFRTPSIPTAATA